MLKQLAKKTIAHILTWQARMVLARYTPNIVAITGNIGKTSAKDSVHAVLSRFYTVRKSEKSFNSEIGLPLTILGIPNAWNDPLGWVKNIAYGFWLIIKKQQYPEWLVLEVGADRPGDIAAVSKWLKSDIVVYTRFGNVPVHVEFFKTPDELFREKSNLLDALKPNGTLILNADDERIMTLKAKARTKVVTFGFDEQAMIQASNDTIAYSQAGMYGAPSGIVFRINYGGSSIPVQIDGGFGRNHVYSALAALAIAYDRECNMLTAVEALKNQDLPPGRMRVIAGVKESVVIDDTYNAAPLATETALETLGSLAVEGRKIAVLGDMLELGRYTQEAHKKVGEYAARHADILVTVGIRSRYTAEGALNAGMSEKNIFQYEDARVAGKFVEGELSKGDIVLVKGSQGMRMERAVEEIMAHPEDKERLLVRQDSEWRKR
ncbi:MAG: Mur ligase family protein [Candidatus Pacebacteria bacterium]|jgi:UDP-N-acetylmuramoyl-tripeptide--D-alanyl-D-alanine ligase|nr:Mur ligase family protein [Candidatus Paceibacterota bacterium]